MIELTLLDGERDEIIALVRSLEDWEPAESSAYIAGQHGEHWLLIEEIVRRIEARKGAL